MMTINQMVIFYIIFGLNIVYLMYHASELILTKIGKDRVKTIMFSVSYFILAFVSYLAFRHMGVI